ncbi:unnamed protein product [Linum trigynum]|uniref:Uncharacterized protein n=1 Tax=Linum trigynum TaxID=586398 RepID=A0AAV2D870_9ROSI
MGGRFYPTHSVTPTRFEVLVKETLKWKYGPGEDGKAKYSSFRITCWLHLLSSHPSNVWSLPLSKKYNLFLTCGKECNKGKENAMYSSKRS